MVYSGPLSSLEFYFDKRANAVEFNPGDLVLADNLSLKNNLDAKFKLSPPWFGPFVVHSRSGNTYQLRTISGQLFTGKFHAIRLKKFLPDLSSETVHSGDEHITNVVNAVSDSDCDDDDDILAACTCLLVLPTRR